MGVACLKEDATKTEKWETTKSSRVVFGPTAIDAVNQRRSIERKNSARVGKVSALEKKGDAKPQFIRARLQASNDSEGEGGVKAVSSEEQDLLASETETTAGGGAVRSAIPVDTAAAASTVSGCGRAVNKSTKKLFFMPVDA
jgi:hypothetical protein